MSQTPSSFHSQSLELHPRNGHQNIKVVEKDVSSGAMNLDQLHPHPQEGKAAGPVNCRAPSMVSGMGHCLARGWQWAFSPPLSEDLSWKSSGNLPHEQKKIRVLSVEEAKVDLGQKLLCIEQRNIS